MPFEVSLELSKVATNINQEVYMYTMYFVEIGGISRATYIAGLILAHLAARELYKAALISELFMI